MLRVSFPAGDSIEFFTKDRIDSMDSVILVTMCRGLLCLSEWWESVEFSSYVCLIDQILTSQCFLTLAFSPVDICRTCSP